MSFSLLIEDQGLVEGDLYAILDPFDSNQFMLCLGIWNSFKCCTLSPSLLFQFELFASHGTLESLLQNNSKTSVFQHSASFMIQLLHPYITMEKTDLIKRIFAGKMMSLFLILSRFTISVKAKSKHLSISWLQSQVLVILETKKIKSVTASTTSPSICHEVMELDAMILLLWMVSFKSAFSLSSFTFKRLFSSSSFSAIRVVSSAYLRVLIFFLAILIPAFDSSSLVFHMMYSACKLNEQGDNIQPWYTAFPILNLSIFSCPVLTVASCQEAGKVVWYSHLFKNSLQFVVIYTVKGFSVVNGE